MVYKNNKRPFSEDESFNVSFKHPRQMDCTSFVGFVLGNNSPEKPHKSGGFYNIKGEEGLLSHTDSLLPLAGDKEFENCAFRSISGSTGEKDAISVPALQVSWPPGFCRNDCHSRMSAGSEEMFSSHASYSHRKIVSIGPDHQADVPVWGSEGARKASSHLDLTQIACDSYAGVSFPRSLQPLLRLSSQFMVDDRQEQLMGTCVIPMPKADSPGSVSGNFAHGRVDCSCLDEGSVRCVRQHVKEAREKLLLTLGQERFMELGFHDMGEDVALKWSEEDEQVFHEVVFSNPASRGKNFWDHLSVVFPTRTKKDLVSYYFNVFILRRRAEQNRLDPSNIDSDNDEWQASDDGDEFASTEEDEDSTLESPANQSKTVFKEDLHVNYHENEANDDEDDDDSDDGAADVASVEDDVGGLDDVSELHVSFSRPSSCKSFDRHKFASTDHHASGDLRNGSEEQDVQDESCTSYESQHSGADSSGPCDTTAAQEQSIETDLMMSHDDFGSGSLAGIVDLGFVFDPCDAKVWDAGFFSGRKNDADFLPTRSMIEEVFRDEMWNDDEGRDKSRIS